jgi:hypothetical protein
MEFNSNETNGALDNLADSVFIFRAYHLDNRE